MQCYTLDRGQITAGISIKNIHARPCTSDKTGRKVLVAQEIFDMSSRGASADNPDLFFKADVEARGNLWITLESPQTATDVLVLISGQCFLTDRRDTMTYDIDFGRSVESYFYTKEEGTGVPDCRRFWYMALARIPVGMRVTVSEHHGTLRLFDWTGRAKRPTWHCAIVNHGAMGLHRVGDLPQAIR